MSIPVGRMEICEVEKLNRLSFGMVSGGSHNDQSLALADLHLDSDEESQDSGKQQYSLLHIDEHDV